MLSAPLALWVSADSSGVLLCERSGAWPRARIIDLYNASLQISPIYRLEEPHLFADRSRCRLSAESPARRWHDRKVVRLIGSRTRRLFLQFGLPWGAALLVGLISVLYARWSTDAYDLFVGWIAWRWWLPLLITPAATIVAVFA